MAQHKEDQDPPDPQAERVFAYPGSDQRTDQNVNHGYPDGALCGLRPQRRVRAGARRARSGVRAVGFFLFSLSAARVARAAHAPHAL